MIDRKVAGRLLNNPTLIYAGYVPAALYQYAVALGSSEQELLSGTGIPSDILVLDSDAYIKLEQYYQLIHNILVCHGNEFSLQIGSVLDGSTIGVVGTMVSNTQTLKEGIEASMEYQSIMFSPFVAEVVEKNDYYAQHIYPPKHCPEEVNRFFTEAIFASNNNAMKSHYNVSDNTMVYSCNYPEPAYSDLYKKYIKGNIIFDQKVSTITYPYSLLDKRQGFGNQLFFDMAVKVCQQRVDGLMDSASLSAKVHRIISDNINDVPKLEAVAALLDMSVSTLKRKLSDEGSSYTSILDGARKDIAVYCIGEKDMAISDVARFLKISNDSNFHKSFRRWTGMTVNEFKEC